MNDVGHLVNKPRTWSDLRSNHQHVLAMIEGHRVATSRLFPPMTQANRHLHSAVCDLLPMSMVTCSDRAKSGGLVLTLLELDYYEFVSTDSCGLAVTGSGRKLLGPPKLALQRLGPAIHRMHMLAAAETVDTPATGAGEVTPS